MAPKQWTICDTSRDVYLDELAIGPQDVGGKASGLRVVKRTLRGGKRHGVDSIRVDNGKFAFEVLPSRGMSLWKAWLGGEEIGWRSPVRGPVHPALVAVSEPSGLGWLDGFDELLVRCGLESNGAPEFDDQGRLTYPLHGRIGNLPAHEVAVSVDEETGETTVTGAVEETRFHFLKLRLVSSISTRVGEPGLRIRDEIQNLSASDAESQLLYHVNFGLPLLDAGSRFVAPLKTVVPRNERAAEGISSWNNYAGEEAGFAEQVYFLELAAAADDRTQVLLKNAHGTRGASMYFNTRQLPCFTVWKNTTAAADGYVTGLEPGTNFPNPRSFEGRQGRVVRLAAGAKAIFDLQLEMHGTAAEVADAERQIELLQAGHTPRIFDQPQAGWCA